MDRKQKRHFLKKIAGVEKTIWDLEFKREKTLMIREDIRVEYDHLQSRQDALEKELEKKKPENATKEIEDQKEKIKLDTERMLKQMVDLDIEVNGCGITVEFPEGHQGINQTLDSLRELLQMLKDYIRK